MNRCLFSKIVIFLFCFITLEIYQNQSQAQTKTLEFAGYLTVEIGTIYLTRNSPNAYAYGLVGAMLGVVVVDKAFLHEGGSIPKLVVGTSVGALLGVTAAIIVVSTGGNIYSSKPISSTGEFLAFALLVGFPSLGATVGYNPVQKRSNSILSITDSKLSLDYPKPSYQIIENKHIYQRIDIIQINLVQIRF